MVSRYVTTPDLEEKFNVFLNALLIAEQDHHDNSGVLALHSIKYEIFHEIDSVSLDQIPDAKIEYFQDKLDRVFPPSSQELMDQYLRVKTDIAELLTGIKKQTLRTSISTAIPYVIHLSALEMEFIWNGIPVKASVKPNVSGPSGTFLMITPAAHPTNATRWQAGFSEISLNFSALIDCTAVAPDIISFEEQQTMTDGTSIQGSPKSFVIAFSVIHDFTWLIRLKYGGQKQWIPSPIDIGSIECQIHTDSYDDIYWCAYQPPTGSITIFGSQPETQNISLGELESPPWYVKCRSLGVMYLEAGETNEALFWLNVGVEALFRERFRTIALRIGKPELELELDSSKAFWDTAEEMVAEQYPQLAGKVRWPDTKIHVSMFAKLNDYALKVHRLPAD